MKRQLLASDQMRPQGATISSQGAGFLITLEGGSTWQDVGAIIDWLPPTVTVVLLVRSTSLFVHSRPAFKIPHSVFKMNPYEAHPGRIPPDDRYADVLFYGRYHATAADFQPDAAYLLSTSSKAIAYWSSVLAQCDETNRIYENLDGDRDVFALGRVIVNSRHLHPEQEGRHSTRDYSLADMNEVAATAVARQPLGELGIMVPEIYFAGKVC